MKSAIYIILLTVSQLAFATGLQPINTDASVRVQAVDFDLEIRGLYVSGLMSVQFRAGSGAENAANLRFPLPPNSVLYKAEMYIPHLEKWVTAETMGRKEGEIIYDRVVKERDDPLLIQKIGVDFYRARVFPVNEQGDLRMRVYYAHTLEPVAGEKYRLRIAFLNQDSTSSTPADGVTVSIRTSPDYWTAGAWQKDETGKNPTALGEAGSAAVDLSNGTAFLRLENFMMAPDIILPLVSNEPRATGLFYQPEDPNLSGHLHVQWNPDFSAYQAMQFKQRNVVFVIDVSGSMSGAKLALTKQAIITSIEALDKDDYFGLAAFDDNVYVFRQNMTKGDDIAAAIEWVANLRSGGFTNMSAGLTTGASIGVRSPLTDASVDLLVISDGLPNSGSSTVPDILADIRSEADTLGRDIRIFGVGIGYNLDQSLLNGLTQQTGGEATFALDDNEITGQILALFARVRDGGFSNATVRIEGINNEFSWLRIFSNTVLHASAKGATGGQVNLILQGNLTDSTPIKLTTTVQPLQVNDNMARIAAPLAAKTATDQMERQIDATGETKELVNLAVAMGRYYGIVTRYTSLLALESEELYAEQGVDLIKRDPAGIALQPIIVSSVDEGRIGGQGTADANKNETTTDDYQFGCTMLAAALVRSSTYPSLTVFCETAILYEDMQIDIPRLSFQGSYFWISLRPVRGQRALEAINYGAAASPEHNPSSCRPDEIVLSTNLQLEIPLMTTRGIGGLQFKDVVLQGTLMDDGSLIFEIVSYVLGQ